MILKDMASTTKEGSRSGAAEVAREGAAAPSEQHTVCESFTRVAHWVLLALVLVHGLSIRLPLLQDGILAQDHLRQANTAMVAKNIAQEGLRFSSIRSDVMKWGTAEYITYQLEFPIFHALVALVHKIGVELILAGRLANLLCFLAACFYIAALTRRLTGEWGAILVFALLLFSPLTVYYSTTFQRDGMLHLCIAAYLFHLWSFFETEQRRALILALAAGAVALLLHPSRAMIVGFVFLIGSLGCFRLAALRKPWFYFSMPAVAAPLAVWLLLLKVAFGGVSADLTAAEGLRDFGSLAYYSQWWRPLTAEFSWSNHIVFGATAVFAPLGLVSLLAPVRGRAILVGLLVGNFAFMVFDSYPFAIVPHRYYFVDGALCLMILASVGVGWILRESRRLTSLIATVALIGATAVYSHVAMKTDTYGLEYSWQRYYFYGLIGDSFQQRVPDPEDRVVAIVASGLPESTMLALGARGWRVDPSRDPGETVQALRGLGCRYCVVDLPSDPNTPLSAWGVWLSENAVPLMLTRRVAVYDITGGHSSPRPLDLAHWISLPIRSVTGIRSTNQQVWLHQQGRFIVHYAQLEDFMSERIHFIRHEAKETAPGNPIAFDLLPKGGVAFLTRSPNSIVEYSSLDEPPTVIPLADDLKPAGIVWSSFRKLYFVSDGKDATVLLVEKSGRIAGRIGRSGGPSWADAFHSPGKLDIEGELIAVNDQAFGRVMIFDPRFRLVAEQGMNGLNRFGRTSSFDLMPDGGVILGSQEVDKVMILDADGRLVQQLEIPNPSEVRWVDSLGALFVVAMEEGASSHVQVYVRAGADDAESDSIGKEDGR